MKNPPAMPLGRPIEMPPPPPPPQVHPVATIRRKMEELVIAWEVYDTGLRFVSLQVWRPGRDGVPVQDHRRRLTLRLEDVQPVSNALRTAGELAESDGWGPPPEAP